MNERDLALLDSAFEDVNNSLVRNRMAKQEQARYNQEQQRLQQQAQAQEQYRQSMLAERVKADQWAKDPQNPLNQQRAAATAKDLASAGAVGQPKFKGYFHDPTNNKTIGFEGSPDVVDNYVQTYKAQHGVDLEVTSEPPGTLKDKKEIGRITIGGNTHIYYSGDEKMFQEAQAKYDQAAKQAEDRGIDIRTGRPITGGARQTVTQHMNPLHFGTGGNTADATQPEFINTTNTVTPMMIGDSGLPNLAPQATPKASIPPAAIKFLQANPDKWKEFEDKYGQGTSSQYLP